MTEQERIQRAVVDFLNNRLEADRHQFEHMVDNDLEGVLELLNSVLALAAGLPRIFASIEPQTGKLLGFLQADQTASMLGTQRSADLNSDVSADEARALHRVVRAMHDGNCPRCGYLNQASHFHVLPAACTSEAVSNHRRFALEVLGDDGGHMCPQCDFAISKAEAAAALQAFQPFMQRNLEVFENWRSQSRASTPAS